MTYDCKLSRQDSVIRSMAAEGASYAQIARAVSATGPGVLSYCKRHGIAKAQATRAGRPRNSALTARNEKMAAMFKQGVTLQKIGEQFGVTRQLVEQVMKRMGLNGRVNGGAAVRRQILGSAADKREAMKAARKAAREKRWGVSDELLTVLRSEGFAEKYRNHKNSAKARGIPFSLTLGQWWAIWQASGHAHERGRGLTGYCMSRICDAGGYVLGNVHIQPTAENSRDAVKQWKGKPPKANRGVFLLYPGLSTPYMAKVGKVRLGLFETEEAAAQARKEYVKAHGLRLDGSKVGRGRGWTYVARHKTKPYYMQGPGGACGAFATAEEAEAAYRAACAAYLARAAQDQESQLPYEIPAHNLAAPRPAPIAFPDVAGVHVQDCAPSDEDDLSRRSQSAETSSTQEGEA